MAKKTKSNLSGSDTNENVPRTPTIKVKGEPDPTKMYYWTVRFGVSAIWVADGFSLDDGRAHDMLAEHLSHAYGHELTAEVLLAPPPAAVAGAQGYNTVEEARVPIVDYRKRRLDIAKRAEKVADTFFEHQHVVTNKEIKNTMRERLRSMIELALCEETGVPWDGNPNSVKFDYKKTGE